MRRKHLFKMVSIFLSLATTGPLVANGATRSSPFEPPDTGDRVFVTDDAPGQLDTRRCGNAIITFNVEVSRVVSMYGLKDDGTLADPQKLVSAGVLSEFATLEIPANDIDVHGSPVPEIDEIWFNGEKIGTLDGDDNKWVTNTFKIPIGKVKFAKYQQENQQPDQSDLPPIVAVNQVKIRVDAGGTNFWCAEFDWAALKFKAISPVILIHGLAAYGDFFQTQNFTYALEKNYIPYDLEIDLFKDGVVAAGETLDRELPKKAKEFGVDSLHVVAHSKGGVDVREYLAKFQAKHNDQFRILSYTSLSTPHHGSVLGDVVIAQREFPRQGNRLQLKGFSLSRLYLNFYRTLTPSYLWQGHVDLSTTHISSFNHRNLFRLPKDIHYNLLAADADANNNGELDIPQEFADGNDIINRRYGVDTEGLIYGHLSEAFKQMYDLLKTTKGVTISHETIPWPLEYITVVKAVKFDNPVKNDIFVNELSASADLTRLQSLAKHAFTFQGPNARSHMGMLNEGVADKVIPWLLETDQTHQYGDLR